MMPSSIPHELRDFVERFNREEFWESHEVLEAAWRRDGSRFYKGLILYASAFVHVQRGNAHGVLAQLEKAERHLRPYRPAHLGIDVDGVLAHAAAWREVVSELRDEGPAAWRARVPLPRLGLNAGEP